MKKSIFLSTSAPSVTTPLKNIHVITVFSSFKVLQGPLSFKGFDIKRSNLLEGLQKI